MSTIAPHPQPAPHPAPAAPVRSLADEPGFTLGIISLVCALYVSAAGLVLGIIALQQSKRAGVQNPAAIAGIVLSSAMLAFTVVLVLASVVMTVIWVVFFVFVVAVSGTPVT